MSRDATARAIASLFLLFPLALPAQQGPRYRPERGEVIYETVNPYRMYWVQGADTIGGWSRERTITRQHWERGGRELRVRESRLTLDALLKLSTDTFEVSERGRLIRANGKPPGLNTQVDLVPHLPATRMTATSSWVDTLDATSTGVLGTHLFQVVRTFRVTGLVDTAGRTIATITATGSVHYRDGWVADSAKRTFVWLDVSGPIREEVRIDLTAGRMLERRWEMTLTGVGGRPTTEGRVDTVPAGLLSSSTWRRIDAARAALVAPSIAGADTSWTINDGLILGHVVRPGADSVVSSMGRNDGMFGTARTIFRQSIPAQYSATWTDSIGVTSTQTITRESGGLRLRTEEGTDTLLLTPAGAWGIADYAMQEHLVPVLRSLPADGTTRAFSVYRPVGRHWDTGEVVIRSLPDGVIVTMTFGENGAPRYLLITTDGDLLYIENSDPTGAQRVPVPGSGRRQRLERILSTLRAGD